MHYFSFFIILICLKTSASSKVYYLQPEMKINFMPQLGTDNLNIYCFEGHPKYLFHIWKTVELELDIKPDKYDLYDGVTEEDVRKKFTEHRLRWTINLILWKKKEIYMNPFSRSCMGIVSSTNYTVNLRVFHVDNRKVLLMMIGIFLILLAGKLSNNTLFHYLCGITLGVTASFIILVYVVGKIFPKKPMMYGFVIGGWTIGIYLLQMLYDNMGTTLYNYHTYVLYYVIATGFISFIICYRFGPVTNKRSKNLIKWALQLFGSIMIYFSSCFVEAAIGIIMVVFLYHNIPSIWISKSKSFWNRRFPPKLKLLTNDEFYQQGIKETSRALDELRTYCSSPECNQWKTVLKLKDAKRFASFIEGSLHLSDDEIENYENELDINPNELTDEELTDNSSSSF